MQYPDTDRLIAMGKYSMHSSGRRTQIERVQTIAKTIMHLANPLLEDAQQKPPTNVEVYLQLQKCLENAHTARGEIIRHCIAMEELRPIAWPGKEEST